MIFFLFQVLFLPLSFLKILPSLMRVSYQSHLCTASVILFIRSFIRSFIHSFIFYTSQSTTNQILFIYHALEREKFLIRIAGNDIAPEVAAQLAGLAEQGHNVPHVEVPKHISRHVIPHFESLGLAQPLDLVILGGTRIIRGPILDYPTHGVLNSHPGLLPDCRGSASPVRVLSLCGMCVDKQAQSIGHSCIHQVDKHCCLY